MSWFFKKIDDKDLVKIPNSTYNTGNGFLGILANGGITWYSCRDSFQGVSEAIQSFLFYHAAKTGDNVVNFIKTFEVICNCPAGQELTLKQTTNKNVLWVGVSDWWRYRVRRSLLTALLRCGQYFVKDTGEGFEQALYSTQYTKGTKEALEWFMSGHTACKMKKNLAFPGWQNFFNRKSKNQIDACLVKLKKKRAEEENVTK